MKRTTHLFLYTWAGWSAAIYVINQQVVSKIIRCDNDKIKQLAPNNCMLFAVEIQLSCELNWIYYYVSWWNPNRKWNGGKFERILFLFRWGFRKIIRIRNCLHTIKWMEESVVFCLQIFAVCLIDRHLKINLLFGMTHSDLRSNQTDGQTSNEHKRVWFILLLQVNASTKQRAHMRAHGR